MKVIKCLSEQIEDELKDASKYVELAMKWRKEAPEVADLFYELSKEEMGHMEKLHNAAEEQIEAYKDRNGDPPKEMKTLYDYLHEKHKETALQIKVMQGMYQQADDE